MLHIAVYYKLLELPYPICMFSIKIYDFFFCYGTWRLQIILHAMSCHEFSFVGLHALCLSFHKQ